MVNETLKQIKEGLNFPFVNVGYSCLGGKDVYILVSLEVKGEWQNDIMENSPYARFVVGGGKIEHFAGWSLKKNFRKCKYKSVEDVISKLNKYYEEVKQC